MNHVSCFLFIESHISIGIVGVGFILFNGGVVSVRVEQGVLTEDEISSETDDYTSTPDGEAPVASPSLKF
jgi:hypothetical protein